MEEKYTVPEIKILYTKDFLLVNNDRFFGLHNIITMEVSTINDKKGVKLSIHTTDDRWTTFEAKITKKFSDTTLLQELYIRNT